MKIKEIMLILLLGLLSCNNEIPDFKQHILFEQHYTNWAWSYQNNGYLIDSLGYIRTFDLSHTTIKWNYPDSLGYISEEKMEENLSHCEKTVNQLNADSLSLYVGKIWGASKGKISQSDLQMADFGEIKYSAYIRDEKKKRYKEVLIKLYGDITVDNSSAEAGEIYGWMNRLHNSVK
jgi:hypothetical protein